jgi:hypothetical protein
MMSYRPNWLPALRRLFRVAALVGGLVNTHNGFAAITFVPGDYYTSNYFSLTITQYDPTGHVVGTFIVPSILGEEVRGMAFGPDGLLYTTVSRGTNGFAVLAFDSSGTVQRTYLGTVYVAGNLSFGKIALDRQYLYVAGQDFLTRYTLGDPFSGTVIYTNNQVFDVKTLANGNLFVASAYTVDEITHDGTLVRNIRLNDANRDRFYEVRGMEYDPMTDDLFVTHLGYTGFFAQLMRINARTGELERNVGFNYGDGDDLFLDLAGDVLVGGRGVSPTFFTNNLDQMGTLNGGQQMFVTRFLPWPTFADLPTSDIVVEATGPEGAPLDFAPTSSDLEGNPNTVVTQPARNSLLPLGTTAIACLAIDRQSHTTSASFNVTVQDTTPPSLRVPATVNVVAKARKRHRRVTDAVARFSVSALDVVDGTVVAIANPPSGSFFPLGTTIVTVSATDSHNNTASATFPVMVKKKKRH